MKDLSNYRKSYEKSELIESSIAEDPITLFKKWFHEVEEYQGPGEVNAMTISTIGLDGFPKSRVVLLKKCSEEGFVFYTNYQSDKGRSIDHNPKVCLSFFWESLERQVIIKGIAQKIPNSVSDAYFDSRPYGSKLGALISNQSEIVPSRDYLDAALKQITLEYQGKEIVRPNHWGGFLVVPTEVEFWQGRPNRLHDRIRYTIQDNFYWSINRVAP
jgi:pyridoxamine 5'-phosphate oxidase